MISQKKSKQALIIFVRVPELGKVKTRLAHDVGDHKALAIYKALLAHTRKIALSIDADRYLYYHNAIANDDWSDIDFIKKVQISGDLGDKLKQAFSYVSQRSEKVIVIGSDCAQLQSDHINQSFSKLDDHDTVIGPSLDGGYYLLGTKDYQAEIFENIEWSTDKVYHQTIAKIQHSNLSVGHVEALSDIDHKADWDQYGWPL